MFNFNHNGKDFKVVFAYLQSESSDSRGTTYADIFSKDVKIEKGVENRKPLARGVTFCSTSDNFNRITGRKIALSRALLNMFPYDKVSRAAVWEVYKKSCKFVSK